MIYFTIIGFIVVLAVMIPISIYVFKNTLSKIDRAKKIDPSVKTLAEAEYVLKKDIMSNVGNTNTTNINCKHCGAKISSESKFCNYCGKKQD